MIINLDTNKLEEIKLTFTDEDEKCELPDLIQDFCFATASLFTDFAMKIDCSTESAKSLKQVYLNAVGRFIDALLEKGLLEQDEDEISDEEIDSLINGMEAAGFNQEEIDNIVDVVKSCGSMEAANEYLKKIGEEAGIDWDAED